MEKESVRDNANNAKPRARLAKVISAKHADGKQARQTAFYKVSRRISATEAVSHAKLFSDVNPAQFRIVRMPG